LFELSLRALPAGVFVGVGRQPGQDGVRGSLRLLLHLVGAAPTAELLGADHAAVAAPGRPAWRPAATLDDVRELVRDRPDALAGLGREGASCETDLGAVGVRHGAQARGPRCCGVVVPQPHVGEGRAERALHGGGHRPCGDPSEVRPSRQGVGGSSGGRTVTFLHQPGLRLGALLRGRCALGDGHVVTRRRRVGPMSLAR